MKSSGLIFGIYPLSVAGTPFGLAQGPEDNYEKIQMAIRDLKGDSKKLFSRNYLIYTKKWQAKMLSRAEQYLEAGLLEDLTLGVGDWTDEQETEIEIELFGLRDADSTKEDLFHQYGIMRDDYSPKPAYYTFKKLIQELGE